MPNMGEEFDIINFFNPKDRLNRLPYNIALAIFLVFGITIDFFIEKFERSNNVNSFQVTLLYLISIALMVAFICLLIRRFHDRNKSGWWVLGLMAASLIPYIGCVACLWIFIEPVFLRGTEGPNDYGPDPL